MKAEAEMPEISDLAHCLDFDRLYPRVVIQRTFAAWAWLAMVEEGSIRYLPKLDAFIRIF